MYSPDDFETPEAFQRQDWVAPPHMTSVLAKRRSGGANMASMFTLEAIKCEARQVLRGHSERDAKPDKGRRLKQQLDPDETGNLERPQPA